MLNFIRNISPTEWLIIALILIVFFGSKLIIKLGKASGETLKQIKNVKKSFSEAVEEEKPDTDEKGVSE